MAKKTNKVRLSAVPEGVMIYMCGDEEKRICGLHNELVAHRCEGCLFVKAILQRKDLNQKAKIHYIKQ